MRTIIRSSEFKEQAIIKEFPENFAADHGFSETVYQTNLEGYTGDTREILLNGICIEHRNIHHENALQLEVHHDFPFFKMHFELKGFSGYASKSKGSRDVTIFDGCHQLFYFPEVKGRLQYAAQQRFTLEIKLTRSFLEKMMGPELAPLGAFGKGLQDNQPVLIGGRSLPIQPAMRNVIYEILHCPYRDMLKKVYLEAKVTELLLMQLAQLEAHREEAPRSVLKSGDAERIRHVKELIEENIQEPCSLIELASRAGLNDFKLKKGFKEMFGNTVFGYMNHVRMEKARLMLLEGRQSIADISFVVGYKNPQHFTAAFKKHFGYLPSDLKC
ncbi:MAG TPA: AraC family transcriptional regulator [Chitinophaga sp.]|uniref:helix-turn-helix transcriptional regulator n=1 Tax=Chitinophaga sp. TaxID=1869181 RepID=UPI002B64CA5B|nr:AraC family transcriptional regulator [Chitinophaga sp.]HVI44179.1 AraC family transcriptional regulator [Chitinophaga sp.]